MTTSTHAFVISYFIKGHNEKPAYLRAGNPDNSSFTLEKATRFATAGEAVQAYARRHSLERSTDKDVTLVRVEVAPGGEKRVIAPSQPIPGEVVEKYAVTRRSGDFLVTPPMTYNNFRGFSVEYATLFSSHEEAIRAINAAMATNGGSTADNTFSGVNIVTVLVQELPERVYHHSNVVV